MLPSQALLLLCHLDNDLVIIILYIYCVVHMTYIPYLGTFFSSRYPSVALARIIKLETGDESRERGKQRRQARTQANDEKPIRDREKG